MSETQQPEALIDYARHRQEWQETRAELRQKGEPATFTIRATIELLHDYLKEARVRNHRFRSDEAKPGGGDEAPNPMGYFVAAVGF